MKPTILLILAVFFLGTGCSTGPDYSRDNPLDGSTTDVDTFDFSWSLDASKGELRLEMPFKVDNFPSSELLIFEVNSSDSSLLAQIPVGDVTAIGTDSIAITITENLIRQFPTNLSISLLYDNSTYHLTQGTLEFKRNEIKVFRLFTESAFMEIENVLGMEYSSNKTIESIFGDPMGFFRFFVESFSNIRFTDNVTILRFEDSFSFNENITMTVTYPRFGFSVDTTISVSSDRVFIDKIVTKENRPFAELSIDNDWYFPGTVAVFQYIESVDDFRFINELIPFVDPMQSTSSPNPFTPIEPVALSGFFIPENTDVLRYKFVMISGSNRSAQSPESVIRKQGTTYSVEFDPQ